MATDSKLATWDMAKAMYETIMATIAPTEASSTASAAYAKGSYFILAGVLYRATAAIARRAAIVTSGANANCEAVPGGLGGVLATLEAIAAAERGEKLAEMPGLRLAETDEDQDALERLDAQDAAICELAEIIGGEL